MIASRFFEDYEAGYVRETLGRTITETTLAHADRPAFLPAPYGRGVVSNPAFGRRTPTARSSSAWRSA